MLPRTALSFLWFFLVALFAAAGSACAQGAPNHQKKPAHRPAGSVRGAEIVRTLAGSEFHLDGTPFFIHAAAFEYYRIPRDLWEISLERHAELGINTILLPVPWNWHELRQGEFDLDGHSHDRRDLRSLLRIVTAAGFKLILNPGPFNSTGWRDAGIPAWILAPAAPDWPAAVSRWYSTLALELAPYASSRTVRVRKKNEKRDAEIERDLPGPLLVLQLETSGGPDIEETARLRLPLSLAELCGPFAGLDALCLRATGSAFPLDQGGQPAESVTAAWEVLPAAAGVAGSEAQPLSGADLSALQAVVESLKAVTLAPPLLAPFRASLPAPQDEPLGAPGSAENTLLASRLLLSRGAKGWVHSPGQDGFTPAGHVAPGRNRHHRWDAALGADATLQPAARAVRRNGALLEFWGPLLAASHLATALQGQPAVRVDGDGAASVAATQLVAGENAPPVRGRTGERGLLVVSNLDLENAFDGTLDILSPRASARDAGPASRISLPVTVPARQSLLLPLHYPLCSATKLGKTCQDEVIAAGAELLHVERDARTLALSFYTPARATVLLHLERQPRRLTLDETKPESLWTPEKRELRIQIPRGASPDFLRTVKIHLPYTPHVPEKPDPEKHGRRDFEFEIADAVRFPLSENSSLPSFPPLILLPEKGKGRLVLQATNHNSLGRDIHFSIDSPLAVSSWMGLDPGETRQLEVKLDLSDRPGGAAAKPAADGLYHGTFEIKSGRDRRTVPIRFLRLNEGGVASYQYDFDRDGNAEWVLENKALRLIVDPADGGRALALVSKESGQNLTTSVGMFRDDFLPGPPRAACACTAKWDGAGQNVSLVVSCTLPGAARGAAVQKTFRLAEDGAEVEYKLAAADGAPGMEAAVSSVPAGADAGRSTRVCWRFPAATSLQCESLAAAGPLIALPDGASRVDVQTPGRAALAVEWTAGRMTVHKKRASALLWLAVPARTPGADPAFTVRITLQPPD